VKAESLSLIRLGVAFMSAGLMMSATLLVAKIVLLDRLGMASAGHFQAAWGFAVFYIDFILQAMGVDFYPHLTSCVHDRKAANQLVNDQTEVALLLGAPLILGMITSASILMRLFYSTEFGAATELVRWLLFGSILKLVSWPMGYLIMARAWVKIFLFVETLWATVYIGVLWAGTPYVGLTSAGYAFCVSYVVYGSALYLITHRLNSFGWTSTNVRLAVLAIVSGVAVMGLIAYAGWAGYLASGLITLGVGLHALRRLHNIAGDHPGRRLARAVRRLDALRQARV
jgi:PST family polysaccharide transporter